VKKNNPKLHTNISSLLQKFQEWDFEIDSESLSFTVYRLQPRYHFMQMKKLHQIWQGTLNFAAESGHVIVKRGRPGVLQTYTDEHKQKQECELTQNVIFKFILSSQFKSYAARRVDKYLAECMTHARVWKLILELYINSLKICNVFSYTHLSHDDDNHSHHYLCNIRRAESLFDPFMLNLPNTYSKSSLIPWPLCFVIFR
jgi:hypothetical protein